MLSERELIVVVVVLIVLLGLFFARNVNINIFFNKEK